MIRVPNRRADRLAVGNASISQKNGRPSSAISPIQRFAQPALSANRGPVILTGCQASPKPLPSRPAHAIAPQTNCGDFCLHGRVAAGSACGFGDAVAGLHRHGLPRDAAATIEIAPQTNCEKMSCGDGVAGRTAGAGRFFWGGWGNRVVSPRGGIWANCLYFHAIRRDSDSGVDDQEIRLLNLPPSNSTNSYEPFHPCFP